MIFQKIYRDQESWQCVVKLIPVVDHFLFNLFSWNPRRIQLIHAWRRRGYISICILSRLLVNHACSKEFIIQPPFVFYCGQSVEQAQFLGPFKGAETCARRARSASLALRDWLARRARLVLLARLQNAKITPVLKAISGQLGFHDTLAISSLVLVRDSDMQRAILRLYFLLFLVPFHVVSGTMAA